MSMPDPAFAGTITRSVLLPIAESAASPATLASTTIASIASRMPRRVPNAGAVRAQLVTQADLRVVPRFEAIVLTRR